MEVGQGQNWGCSAKGKKQVEVIRNHENIHIPGIGQSEARHRKYKRLKLGGGLA
jgi:hypothetical protein